MITVMFSTSARSQRSLRLGGNLCCPQIYRRDAEDAEMAQSKTLGITQAVSEHQLQLRKYRI